MPIKYTLWFSITFMTAMGAVVGYLAGTTFDHTMMVAIEGVAAGAWALPPLLAF